MRKICILTARMGASRMPGKPMKLLGGQPMMRWVVDRHRPYVDDIIIATTTNTEDDIIAATGAGWGIQVYRGSADDVLGRMYRAAQIMDAEAIVRGMACCPFIDCRLMTEAFTELERGEADLVGHHTPGGQMANFTGAGVFCVVWTFDVMDRINRQHHRLAEREHVTAGIFSRPMEFKIKLLPLPDNYDCGVQLEVDTPEQLARVRERFKRWGAA